MNDNQPISAACVAALLSNLLPELARVETYPQWSDGTGKTVRRQRVTLYDAEGRIVGADLTEHRSVLRVLMQVEGGDWDRPQSFDVAGEALSLRAGAATPLWLSPAAAADCPCERGEASDKCSPRGCVPDAGALLEQRHQLEDPSEPPLGGAEPDAARDCAASLAAGLMQPVGWDDADGCEPQPAPAREAADAPVQGGAL